MKTLILAGGIGTRLFPLSRGHYPKQFLKKFDDHLLFQNLRRALIFSSPGDNPVHRIRIHQAGKGSPWCLYCRGSSVLRNLPNGELSFLRDSGIYLPGVGTDSRILLYLIRDQREKSGRIAIFNDFCLDSAVPTGDPEDRLL